jgi:hypothetical protein
MQQTKANNIFYAKLSSSMIMKHTHYCTGLSTAYQCFLSWVIKSIVHSTLPTRMASAALAGQHRTDCVSLNNWVVLWTWMLRMLLSLKCFDRIPPQHTQLQISVQHSFGKCNIKVRTTFQTGIFLLLLDAYTEHCYISNSKAFWIFSNLIFKAWK